MASAASNAQAIPALPTTSTLPAVLAQLESVLLGKRRQLELALACVLAEGHLLIEDVPGVGKTTLAHALSRTLGLSWKRVQFTNDLLPADLIGFQMYDSVTQQFDFRRGPVFSEVLLADEINRAPPKSQSALLEAMEERQVTVDGETHALPAPFFVIATQNPTDQLGAFPLPESQLDRFLISIELGYPDPGTERELLEFGDQRHRIDGLEPLADTRQLQHWVRSASEVHVDGRIFDYIQSLLGASREAQAGLSPRAGLNLVRACRAHALVLGRDHVLPDDVLTVFPGVAAHRLGGSVRQGLKLAQQVLAAVPAP